MKTNHNRFRHTFLSRTQKSIWVVLSARVRKTLRKQKQNGTFTKYITTYDRLEAGIETDAVING